MGAGLGQFLAGRGAQPALGNAGSSTVRPVCALKLPKKNHRVVEG